MYSRTLQSFNCDVLHRRHCAESDKIPESGTSTDILHLSGLGLTLYLELLVHGEVCDA
jgi:hypothetical protein